MARPLQCDTVSEQLFVGMHPESQHLEGTVQKIPPTNYKLNQTQLTAKVVSTMTAIHDLHM